MARQVQFRRGTATEHNTFTGAPGEVTVDTTNHTLRVHDGETVGGTMLARANDIPQIPQIPSVPNDIMSADYVVEWQNPTAANNYTWYRKYKSGWVEQGGKNHTLLNTTPPKFKIFLPVRMTTTNYSPNIIVCLPDVDTGAYFVRLTELNADSFCYYLYLCNFVTENDAAIFWSVRGV